MNIVKELNILLEKFKFEPRRIQVRKDSDAFRTLEKQKEVEAKRIEKKRKAEKLRFSKVWRNEEHLFAILTMSTVYSGNQAVEEIQKHDITSEFDEESAIEFINSVLEKYNQPYKVSELKFYHNRNYDYTDYKVKLLHKPLLEEFKFEPRRIQSRENDRIKRDNELLSKKVIYGDLELQGNHITNLGNVEVVKGCLILTNCINLKNLGPNLKEIGEFLEIIGSYSITNIEEDLKIGTKVKSSNNILVQKIVGDPDFSNQWITKSTFNDRCCKQREKNLKEEFKFQPRKIEDRKEKQEEIEKKKLEGFFSCIGTVDEFFEFFKKKTDRLDSRTKETCFRLFEDPRTKTKDGLIFIRKLSNKIKVGNGSVDPTDAIIVKIQYNGSLVLGSISTGLEFKDHILNKEGGFIDKETFYKVIGRLLDLSVKEILEFYKGEKLKEGFKFEPRRIKTREDRKEKMEEEKEKKILQMIGSQEELKEFFFDTTRILDSYTIRRREGEREVRPGEPCSYGCSRIFEGTTKAKTSSLEIKNVFYISVEYYGRLGVNCNFIDERFNESLIDREGNWISKDKFYSMLKVMLNTSTSRILDYFKKNH